MSNVHKTLAVVPDITKKNRTRKKEREEEEKERETGKKKIKSGTKKGNPKNKWGNGKRKSVRELLPNYHHQSPITG